MRALSYTKSVCFPLHILLPRRHLYFLFTFSKSQIEFFFFPFSSLRPNVYLVSLSSLSLAGGLVTLVRGTAAGGSLK